ncbi:MAG: serine protease [Ilumatobacter sp.]|nr:serine protease [Ilumatobacter sp.]
MLAVAAMLGSCGADGPDGPRDTAIDRDAAIAAAVDVRADGCGPRIGFGSGAVIGGGDIVTAAHVVAGASAIEVIDIDGVRSAATAVYFDPQLDLAVLRPVEAVGTPVPLRRDDARAGEAGIVVLPRLTEDAVVVEVAEVSVIRAVNIETTDIYREADVTREGFEVEGSIDPGDSGALVVLPGGGAGIVWARSNRRAQRAWAIDLPTQIRHGTAPSPDARPVDVGPCLP